MVKKGTSASPATALASRVLPVPGEPDSSTPLGILPPSFWNCFGSFRNSTTTASSSLASSTPATWAKVILFLSCVSSLARPLPEAHGAAAGVFHLTDKDKIDDDEDEE